MPDADVVCRFDWLSGTKANVVIVNIMLSIFNMPAGERKRACLEAAGSTVYRR